MAEYSKLQLRTKIYYEEVHKLRDGAAEKQQQWDAWKADQGEKPDEQFMKDHVGVPLSESEISSIAAARADSMLADRLAVDDLPIADPHTPAEQMRDDEKIVPDATTEATEQPTSDAPIFMSKEDRAAMDAAKQNDDQHTIETPPLAGVISEKTVDTGNHEMNTVDKDTGILSIEALAETAPDDQSHLIAEKIKTDNADDYQDIRQESDDFNKMDENFAKDAFNKVNSKDKDMEL